MKVEINKRKAAPKIPDRIDIHCEIQAVPFAQLSQMQTGETSAAIRERVIRARKIQEERFKNRARFVRHLKIRVHYVELAHIV